MGKRSSNIGRPPAIAGIFASVTNTLALQTVRGVSVVCQSRLPERLPPARLQPRLLTQRRQRRLENIDERQDSAQRRRPNQHKQIFQLALRQLKWHSEKCDNSLPDNCRGRSKLPYSHRRCLQ